MKKINVGLLVALAMILLTACGDGEEKLQVSYQKGTVAFKEVYGVESYNNSKESGTVATAEHITYYFAADLNDVQIKEYVKNTNKLILQLEKEAKIDDREYDIYVCNVDYETTVDGNTLYVSYSDLGSLEYVRSIAQLIYGNEVNYGLLYGYAASFAKDYGFAVKTDGLAEALQLRETNPEYLDMNYACFNDHYVEPENIEKLQVIAVNYYSYLEKNKKTDLVKNFSDEKHREYFNEFLAANGVEAYDNSDMDGVCVYSGGNAAEFIWSDNVATYYVEKGVEASFLHMCFERDGEKRDMLNSSYADLRQLMLDYQEQIRFVNEKLKVYEEIEVTSPVIVFTERGDYSEGAVGNVDTSDGSIQVYMLANVQQMYLIDLIYQVKDTEAWLLSSMTTYYINYPGNTEASYIQKNGAMYVDKVKADPSYDGETYELICSLEEYLGHELELSEKADSVAYHDALTLYYGIDSRPQDNTNSMIKASFVFYLVDLVGEENAMKAMLTNDAEGTFGKSWEELQDEWEDYIRTEFDWVIKE